MNATLITEKKQQCSEGKNEQKVRATVKRMGNSEDRVKVTVNSERERVKRERGRQ